MVTKEQKEQIIAEYGRTAGSTITGSTDCYPDS